MSLVGWSALNIEEQTLLFNNLKEVSKYRDRTYVTNNIDGRYIEPKEVTRGHIYRPLKELPDNLNSYTSYLLCYYPDGELLDFHNKEVNYTNYTILYNWVNGNCISCGCNSIKWDTRNTGIEYYCNNCSSETFFVNTSHAYRRPREVSY
jgi:hypothetical protein